MYAYMYDIHAAITHVGMSCLSGYYCGSQGLLLGKTEG